LSLNVKNIKSEKEFRKFYDSFSALVYGISLRYLKNEHDAKDALQETFIRAHNKIETYKSIGSLEGWIRKVTVNLCIEKLRSNKKKKSFFEKFHYDEDKFDVPSEIKLSQNNQISAIELISHLPDGYRTIINLSIVEGYNHSEIAEMLSISVGTSRSQLARAKEKLKQMYNQTQKRYERI